MGISVSIICFNEEKKIRRCLESVMWADEIVVLDSFSTDGTLGICAEYTDKIYRQPFEGHIEQKNRALDRCSHKWVFCIDADEVVTDELRKCILGLDLIKTEARGFYVARRVFYIGKWINHGGWYPDYKARLVHRDFARWGGINPHDELMVSGKKSKLSGDLLHYSYQDISAHLEQVNKFTDIISGEYKKLGKKPSVINLTVRPIFKFVKMYFIKLGFLDGIRGLIIACTGAFYVFMKFAKLYEKNMSRE